MVLNSRVVPLFMLRLPIFSGASIECPLFRVYKIEGAGLPQFLGWPEVFISFSLTLSHSVPRHYTSCWGLVLRARECVSPAEAVPIRSLVTGRLASGGDRTRNPLRRKRA